MVNIMQQLIQYVEQLVPRGMDFILSLAIGIIVFFVGSKLIKKLLKIVRRSMEKREMDPGVISFFLSASKITLYVFLVIIVAQIFGFAASSIIAIVGSAGLAIGLALQGSLANFAGGVLILIMKPFCVGDYIIVGDVEGVVQKIDFYLLYVLLFAVIYGQRQATFSGILATAGYLFRQMYTRSGLAVVTDYNTYVWIAEIFIVGLVVGYMKDSLLFLKEEKEWEVGFLSEQVTDIGDINDSNLRVKEGLIDQVINYDNSLGTVYDATEQLEQEQSVEIFFCALNMIQKLMDCPDVAIYRVNKEKYARLFAYSSAKAASMGSTVYLPDKKPLDEACNENRVYINRSMEKEYPMMAYNVESEEQMEILIMLWSIPFSFLPSTSI